MKRNFQYTRKEIFKEYLKFQFKSKKTYLILCSFIIFYWLIVLIDFLIQHSKVSYLFVNSLSTATIINFVSSLLAFGLKIGLLNKTLGNLKNTKANLTKNSEAQKLEKMSQSEKNIYYKQKELKENYYNSFYYKTSFPYVLNLTIWFLIFMINVLVTYI